MAARIAEWRSLLLFFSDLLSPPQLNPTALGGKLEKGVEALMYTPSEYDARSLHDALHVREPPPP